MDSEKEGVAFRDRPTVGGHPVDEVVSTLQKAARRGDEELALWAVSELELSGFGAWAFKRLRVIASEDIGLADELAAVKVRACYENWLDMRKANDGSDRLMLMHATLIVTRARKSRLVDHALMAFFEGERPARVIPDYAIDKHTKRGRQLQRSHDHFFDVGAQLGNEAPVDDPYRERARAARSATSPVRGQAALSL